MVTQEWTLTSKDGLRLAARGWAVESPKGAVALVHGHGEHSMRYRHVADFFAANNLSTYAFDHRGHGISEGKRGHSPNYDSILGDVGDFVDQVKEKNRDLPIFVYGHSMGGNLVLNYGHNRPAGVKGVVCSSPWIRLAFAPPKAKVILANVLESIYPSLTLSSGLDSRSLSHDGAVCDAHGHCFISCPDFSASEGPRRCAGGDCRRTSSVIPRSESEMRPNRRRKRSTHCAFHFFPTQQNGR